MIHVVLVCLSDALPSCLGSWEDLLSYANRLSVRRGGGEVFTVARWLPGDAPPNRPEVALVPARVLDGFLGGAVQPSPAEIGGVLRRWSVQGSLLGAVCAGAFVLAEAGLLDGRRATTHWSLAAEFHRRFPRVLLDPEALVVEDEGFLIGGGMTSYFDLGLRLVRRFAGVEVARDCAAVFLLDPERQFQSPYAPVGAYSSGGIGVIETDEVLARAMDWAFGKATLDFGVDEWAAAIAVEKRTLERRARAAWGFGPAERLRRLRIDRARLLVSGGTMPWDEVSSRCGYRDSGAFRRLFLERLGTTPGEYRRRFG